DTTCAWYLLNEREQLLVEQLDRDYLARYQRLPASDPDLVYFLGDRYEFSRTWSAPSNSLPTFRRNTGKFLHRQSLTFLCPQDKLAALGWPMTLGTANEMGTTPFPALDPHRADEMAGNSMFHLRSTAAVLGASVKKEASKSHVRDLPLCLRKHQDLFPCWLSAKPSAKPGKAVGTLVAPPPGPPPKPVGAIMWPGGYMAGAEAAVVAKEPRMKAKGPPSKTRGTSAVERYSSAYSTVGHFPNGHLQDWLHAIAPKFFTLIMVGRLDRNQLLSYLYLLTGLLPSDRPPSFSKTECLEALCSEHERLGSPGNSLQIKPEKVVAYVQRLLSETGGDDDADDEVPEDDEEEPTGGESSAVVAFTVNFVDDVWTLNGWDTNGQLISSAALPELDSATCAGFYQIIYQDGHAFAWGGGSTEGIYCMDYLAEHTASGSAGPGRVIQVSADKCSCASPSLLRDTWASAEALF
ncbi:unnamed protein product, partial [Symbiodinium microadriaticum]